LYQLDANELSVAYKIDFGKFAYPTEKLLGAKNPDKYTKILKERKYIGNISNIHLTDKYLYFNYSLDNGGVNTYIQNLITDTNIHYYGARTSDIGISFSPIASDGNFFYSLLKPWEFPKANLEKLNAKYNLQLTEESTYSLLIKYNYKQ
jgi:hypothetical protein